MWQQRFLKNIANIRLYLEYEEIALCVKFVITFMEYFYPACDWWNKEGNDRLGCDI